MLNPDGVVNGNYRCSLAGVDLNRQWHAPIKQEHPTVYALKMLLRSLQCQAPGVALYCDIHGHSRHKGTFMYGLPPPKTKGAAASSNETPPPSRATWPHTTAR